ncbi:MAG: hypothetical protein A2096_16490 [Spirochaetes bacterium GWF1_41_5]|nr:MAG: hypothetical protein A2096_16490 [Spirochaetes bacterium GWF1_41_5]HBE04499.1 hypothetical protein [Spirochaetia bacterium]
MKNYFFIFGMLVFISTWFFQLTNLSAARPGLFDPEGNTVIVRLPGLAGGKRILVTDYGADLKNNEKDDAAAVRSAVENALPGDTVFFPAGVYNLRSGSSCHFSLKSGVSIAGENKNTSILISDFIQFTPKNHIINGKGVNNLAIRNLTLSSRFNEETEPDHKSKAPFLEELNSGIRLESSSGVPSSTILIENLIIERFQNAGISILDSSEITVRSCEIKNAISVAGGGRGYGICLQGKRSDTALDEPDDCRYNIIEKCIFKGPRLRHAVIIQNFAHNNLVISNIITATRIDSIDLHGEDEYRNEICFNTITDCTLGSAIGVGNNGSTHDGSGPENFIHHNLIRNCLRGIEVVFGSPQTIIADNIITENSLNNGVGLLVRNGPKTVLSGNNICGNTGSGFWGIILEADPGTAGKCAGDPSGIIIRSNKITGNSGGIKISAGKNILYFDNQTAENINGNLLTDIELKKENTCAEQ